VRELNKILELDIELGPIGGLHYKVDRNQRHRLHGTGVATVTFREIRPFSASSASSEIRRCHSGGIAAKDQDAASSNLNARAFSRCSSA